MNHASNLRYSTLCGKMNKELPPGDHSLAALIEKTQSEVDCQECRKRLGLELLKT